MRTIELTKCAEDFHPASVKPIVKGEDAVVEDACTSCSDVEGQIRPWKKDIPIKTKRIRYRIELVA
jgi:hypothetical protein